MDSYGFEVLFRETISGAPPSPHITRVRACFELIKAISSREPHLKSVLELLYSELSKSVFSQDITLYTQQIGDPLDINTLERVPWFTLFKRIEYNMRDIAASTQIKLDEVMRECRLKDREMGILHKRLILVNKDMDMIDKQNKELTGRIEASSGDVERIKAEFDNDHLLEVQKYNSLMSDFKSLEGTLNQARQTIASLNVLKVTEKDFVLHNDPSIIHIKYPITVPEPIKLAKISIHNSECILRQLIDVKNALMDDLDIGFSQIAKKRDIMEAAKSGALKGAFLDHTAEIFSKPSRSAEEEFNHLSIEFKKKISVLLKEKTLLESEIISLKKSIIKNSQFETSLEWHKFGSETYRRNAFKMLGSAENCNHYTVVKECEYCDICCDRVLYCPHTKTAKGIIVNVEQYSRIKLVNPKLLMRDFTISKIEEVLEDESMVGIFPTADVRATHAEFSTFFNLEGESLELYIERRIQSATPSFKVIWHNYFTRLKGIIPVLHRQLNSDKISSMINDIFEFRLLYEKESQNSDPFLSTLVTFALKKYSVHDIALQVTFELLSALERHQESGEIVKRFISCLTGVSEYCWKYMTTIKEWLTKLDPIDDSKFTQLIDVVYPNRPPGLKEELKAQFFSDSKRVIDVEFVFNQIRKMFLANKDLNVFAYKNICSRCVPGTRQSHLTKQQFCDLMKECFPLIHESVVAQHYQISEHVYGKGKVSVLRLGQIMAYLFMTLRAPKLNQIGLPYPSNRLNLEHLKEDLEKMPQLDELYKLEDEEETFQIQIAIRDSY